MACIDSNARVQILHGDKGVGKTTTLLLKMFALARRIKKKTKILFTAATQNEVRRTKYLIRKDGIHGKCSVRAKKIG